MRGMRQAIFTERYCKWCERNGYNFNSDKVSEIYAGVKGQTVAQRRSDQATDQQAIDSLNTIFRIVGQLKVRC